MQLLRIPIAVELFKQWKEARGSRPTTAQRPFSRGWEDLLQAAGVVSAGARRDAEQDAREMAGAGWVLLKPVRHRPRLLDRILLPREQEERWQAAFGHVPSDDDANLRQHGFRWGPELAFLSNTRASLPFDDLRALDDWLARTPKPATPVPIKERSLEIFGDEKRLDGLASSSVFEPGRLTLERLGCCVVPEPLAWKRGPGWASDRPLIVLENAATWHSYDRWNALHGHFSAVVYGSGNRFRDSVGFLAEVFRELGGSRRVLYFGDLDPAGLRIPRVAASRAVAAGLPPVEPHSWGYRALWGFRSVAAAVPESAEDVALEEADLAWLGELGETASPWLRSGRRLPQEHLGWEFLRAAPAVGPEIHEGAGPAAHMTMPPSTVRT